MKKLIENMVEVKLAELTDSKNRTEQAIKQISMTLTGLNNQLESTNNQIAELEEFLAKPKEKENEQVSKTKRHKSRRN